MILKNLAEKELANRETDRDNLIKSIEATKVALAHREQQLKELDIIIKELKDFLTPKENKKGKK